jgi:2-keto-4-pentenoate hydratase
MQRFCPRGWEQPADHRSGERDALNLEASARQSRFPPVQAGEVISTGTLTELFPVSPGETWSTTIGGIELPGLSISIE